MVAAFYAVLSVSCYGGTAVGGLSGAGTAWQPHVIMTNWRSSIGSNRLAVASFSMSSSDTSSSSSSSSSPTEGTTLGFGSRTRRRRNGGVKRTQPAGGRGGDGRAAPSPVVVLKRSNRWACVKGCGACCYLAPEERPDIAEYLPNPKELDLYMSMAADDGWCRHFDKKNKLCTIYEDRPRFCRVETETFGDIYGVDPEDMDEFCSSCCSEHIGDVYGGKSKTMRTFKAALAALERGERPNPELNPLGGDYRGDNSQIRDWVLEEKRAADARRP